MFSIQKLTVTLVDLLLVNYDEKKKYREIYEYSMEILLSTIVNLVVVITISLALGIESNVFWYCLFFLPYRFLFGGAHAKTHVRCIVTFIICMLTSIFIAKTMPFTNYIFVTELVILIISMISNYYYAKVIGIRKGFVYIIIPIIMLVFVNLVLHNYTNGMCATFGLLTQAISFFIKNKGVKENEKIIK